MMQKAKIPVNAPDSSLPPHDRGTEPPSFMTKKAAKKAPLLNMADRMSPLPNGVPESAEEKKYTDSP